MTHLTVSYFIIVRSHTFIHGRFNSTGVETEHANSILSFHVEFLLDVAGRTDQGGFRRTVSGAETTCHDTGSRGNIDDDTFIVLAHRVDDREGDRYRPKDVDRHQSPPVLRRGIHEGSKSIGSGIIHENRDGTKSVFHLILLPKL